MTLIVGIDPGGTTGVCIIKEPTSDGSDDFQVVGVHQIPWEDRLPSLLALMSGSLVDGNGERLLPEIVVVENFHVRPGQAIEPSVPSVRIIGIIEAFWSLQNPRPLLVFQDPVVIGRTQILEQHKALFKGLIHAGDAYRHARYYHLTTHPPF